MSPGEPALSTSEDSFAPPRPIVHQLRILRVLATMDFKLKYADSVLGYVWSLVKPMALFLVLYVVFGRFVKLGVGFHGYPIYLLTGIVLWTFFIDATNTTLTSIVARGSLLRRLAFPPRGWATTSAATVFAGCGGRLLPILVAFLTLALGLFLFRRESPWFAERV